MSGEYDGKFNDIFHQLDRFGKAMENVNSSLVDLSNKQSQHTVILKQHHNRSNQLEAEHKVIERKHNETLHTVAREYSDLKMELHKMESDTQLKLAEIKAENEKEIAKIMADVKPMKEHVKEMGGFAGLVVSMPTVVKVVAGLFTILSSMLGMYFTIMKVMELSGG